MSKVNVQVVNRLRLVSAVLAGSEWPAYEQEQMGTHAVHPHAKATRHYVSDYADHPAVTTINALLPAGLALSELFSTAVRCDWPMFEPQEPLPGRFSDGVWASQLGDFYVDTALAAFFWADQAAPWAEAENDLRRIFNSDSLYQLLGQLSGTPPAQDLVIMPNLNYPAMQAVVASNRDHIYLLLPPPKAVGESPPWPYRDGVDWVLAESCYQLSGFFLAENLARLAPRQQALLRHAITITYLGQAQDEASALFYTIRCKTEDNLPEINAAVDVVRDYLTNPAGADLAIRLDTALT